MQKAICLTLLLAAAWGQNFNGGDASWYCLTFLKEQCEFHEQDLRCGSNGVTYKNMCALGQAHCRDSTVNQAYLGQCLTFEQPLTTRSHEQAVHGSELILDFQCIALSHRTCEFSINEKICGTDGQTYQDFCEYEKARCTHRDLHVKKLGECSA